jgi:hypothetical protein
MTNLVRYLTHPQVKIDPVIPVPSWGLSEVGRARTEAIASTGRLSGTTQIISSGELKAIETAEIIAAKLNINVEVREAMHENDRSATGFLMPDEFEAVANQFFARPQISFGAGSERLMPNCALFVRSNTSWLEIDPAMCSLSATAASVLSCIVIILVLRLIEPATNQLAVVTFSRSPRTVVACSIHGVASKTYDFAKDGNSAE